MDILVSHFPFHCFGQSSKDMSECSSDQLDQSVRIGGCFICVWEWLVIQKQLAGSIVSKSEFGDYRFLLTTLSWSSQRLESFLPSVVLQFQVQARVCFVVVDFS